MATPTSERRMTPNQYRAILGDLGLNIAQAGRYLGVSERTSHRYVRGETPIPEAHAMLLRATKRLALGLGEVAVVPEWRSDRKRG